MPRTALIVIQETRAFGESKAAVDASATAGLPRLINTKLSAVLTETAS